MFASSIDRLLDSAWNGSAERSMVRSRSLTAPVYRPHPEKVKAKVAKRDRK